MTTYSVYTWNYDFNRWKGLFDILWGKPFTFSVFVTKQTECMNIAPLNSVTQSPSVVKKCSFAPRVLVAEIIKNYWRAECSTHLGLRFLYILDTSSACRTASRMQSCSCPRVKHSVLVVLGQMLCYSFVDYINQFMFCCVGTNSFIFSSFLLLLFFFFNGAVSWVSAFPTLFLCVRMLHTVQSNFLLSHLSQELISKDLGLRWRLTYKTCCFCCGWRRMMHAYRLPTQHQLLHLKVIVSSF